MIHSMAGGMLGKVEYSDYAKVEVLEGEMQGNSLWYKTSLVLLKVGDKVLVPVGAGDTPMRGVVLRIDRSVSSQNSPVPSKRAKYIIKIIK